MAKVDLNQCAKACTGCIHSYIKKHTPKKTEGFKIKCSGIPKQYIGSALLQSLSARDTILATSVMDPVTWAAEKLDWHCIDPDGEVWKRKNPNEYWKWIDDHPGESIEGHSRYHRPYQMELLRCTSKRKVFRMGRQVGKSEALVLSMLFHAFTQPDVPEDEGFKIILITPYQSQIDLLFSRMQELIEKSPELMNSIHRSVKSPQYYIKLKNGSIIKGFTAGTKSGGNAASVRGQNANMLVFDEADYLNPADLDAAMSIITNHPQASVWMSSTPSGKREKFYETCGSKRYKEFHYPSQANPLFNDDLDATFKEALSESAYVHEVLADFGEQAQGVFQNQYVQAAKFDYRYGEMAPDHQWNYSIGVDWNDVNNGTTINVLGHNPLDGILYIVDRAVVGREGWTQQKAMQKIVEYNRIWKPMSIYADKGFGGTQIELLRDFGAKSAANPQKKGHPDARIHLILKEYDFGSKIETRDIWTRKKVKKPAKGFLVEESARRFEANAIRFSEYDTALEAQLLGYIIDRVSTAGAAIYKAGNVAAGDHALDALMLSIVAFSLELGPLGKPKLSVRVGFSDGFGTAEKRRSPEVLPGSLIVEGTGEKKRSDFRPSSNRTDSLENQRSALGSFDQTPAANLNNNDNSVFTNRIKSLVNKSFQTVNKTSRKGRKPTRKNI